MSCSHLGPFCLNQDNAYKIAYMHGLVFPRDLFPLFRGQDCQMLPKRPNYTILDRTEEGIEKFIT